MRDSCAIICGCFNWIAFEPTLSIPAIVPRCQVLQCPPVLWSHVVQSREVSPCNFHGHAAPGMVNFALLPYSVEPIHWAASG